MEEDHIRAFKNRCFIVRCETDNNLAQYAEGGLFTDGQHTHEDIDQMFSCILRHISKINVLTLIDLLREISRSNSPAINA